MPGDEVVEVLGTWEILEFSHTKEYKCKSKRAASGYEIRKRHYWLVKCLNCGAERKSIKTNLISTSRGGGRIRKNRCQNCWGRIKGESGMLVLLDRYIRNSKNNNREFSLTKEEFKNLTSSACHYCGSSPMLVRRGGKQTAKTTWGDYKFNGIDRIDNSIGYVLSNCVSCCMICNRGKNNMLYNEFVDYINRIKENNE